MKRKAFTDGQQVILDQVQAIARALGETLAPFTEVVVHDLRSPKHAILAIHNNLSGRRAGDPATELGLARIEDDHYPQVIANYPNELADGRRAKSTSIGIKDADGHYFAALCLNVDVTAFRNMTSMLEQFTAINGDEKESIDPANADRLRERIDQFAVSLATTPRALRTDQRRELIASLKDDGFLEFRRSVDIAAQVLGVSRATVYNDIK